MPSARLKDEQGWIIPQRGTTIRQIYEMTKAGTSANTIADTLEMTVHDVHRKLYYIRHPEKIKQYEQNRREKLARCVVGYESSKAKGAQQIA